MGLLEKITRTSRDYHFYRSKVREMEAAMANPSLSEEEKSIIAYQLDNTYRPLYKQSRIEYKKHQDTTHA